MPRANRHYVPGHIWHLTHRCHDRQFLLNAEQDRRTWTRWARESRDRFGLCILDYSVTCNHIHLLVQDRAEMGCIARSMQLTEGSVAQAYNRRRNRKGSFWEDRYHATAVSSGSHFRRCIGYIALNMVRAGAVKDPALWPFCGYADIQNRRRRNQVVDYKMLGQLLGTSSLDDLRQVTRDIVEETRLEGGLQRQPKWTEALAVGNQGFVEDFKNNLGVPAKSRETAEELDGTCLLREDTLPYGDSIQQSAIPETNTFPWRIFPDEFLSL